MFPSKFIVQIDCKDTNMTYKFETQNELDSEYLKSAIGFANDFGLHYKSVDLDQINLVKLLSSSAIRISVNHLFSY